ncbi:hypothetical protein ATANTOWER_026284 [Ataeniobius toweri]|uniref:Uncharacterized protein n=1 Tax=Ataeniobius toweri TaxID=208326 RepID=A0ABU7A9N0_9TELE|nr:hypothetical protein [Ataeniobius toweri]
MKAALIPQSSNCLQGALYTPRDPSTKCSAGPLHSINKNITTLQQNKSFRPKKSNGYLVKTLINESLEHRFANSFNIKLVLNNSLPGHSLYESIHGFDKATKSST